MRPPPCERITGTAEASGTCGAPARFDVLYRIKTEEQPRGIRVCLAHMEELQQLRKRDALADWDAKEIR